MALPENFCPAPWAVHQLNNEGTRKLCCVHTNLNPDEAYVAHAKETFLRGEKLAGCEHCHFIEDAGLDSIRKAYNRWLTPSLDMDRLRDPQYKNVLFYDLAFGNTCNQKCRMCGPHLSTGWVKDAKKLRMEFHTPIVTVQEQSRIDAIVEEIMASDGPLYFELKGGEPFLLDEVDEFLKRLVDLNVSHRIARMAIVTNGTVYSPEILSSLAKIPNVRIKLSLDAVGPLHGYVRGYAGDWGTVEDCVQKILDALPNATFEIANIVMSYNVFRMHELEEWISREPRFLQMLTNVVSKPPILCIKYLPEDVRAVARKSLERYTHQTKGNLLKLLSEPVSEEEVERKMAAFVAYTKALDALRGENVLDIVPELAPVFERYDRQRMARIRVCSNCHDRTQSGLCYCDEP